jgi:hypothetical protein
MWKHHKGGRKNMSKQDRYNRSGCLDMTAYLALRNIEKEESRRKKKVKPEKQGKKKSR